MINLCMLFTRCFIPFYFSSFYHLKVGLMFATVAFCNEISNEVLKGGSDNIIAY